MPYKPRNLTEEIETLAKERVKNPKPLDKDALDLRDLIADCDDLSVVANSDDELLSIEHAAELLGVSLQTLRNWDKQGKLAPASRTAGNHRRYLRSQVNSARKMQMDTGDILLHDITPTKIRELMEKLLSSFNPDEPVNLTIKSDTLDRKVRLIVDSADGLCSVTKTFNMED